MNRRLLIACLALPGALLSQSNAVLRGRVTDPSGGAVPNAAVTLSGKQLATKSARTDVQGEYQIQGLGGGTYTVRVTATGFAPFAVPGYEVAAGRVQVLDMPLALPVNSEQITVADNIKVDMDPSSNASALVLRGKDLDALSDDPDDLTADLQALAGSAAGPDGGQIYIDGFTGGRLPPKSSIREVRVNQSPFAAQFDKLGYGRIEIFTKPGTEELHGNVLFQYGNDLFNSRNPFTPVKPPYERRQWEGEFSGSLGKKTSFSGDFEIRNINENAFINAVTLDGNLQPLAVVQAVVTPLSGTEENLKIDRQLSANHTLTASYMYSRDTQDNQGIGGFSLVERAYQNHDSEDRWQAVESGIFGTRLVHETRARYTRQRSRQQGVAGQFTTNVLDSFIGGGPPLTLSFNNQDRIEVQDLTTYTHGTHLMRWGGRLRGVMLKDQDTNNYTGSYTFSSLTSYQLTLAGIQNGLSPQQIRASGGGASQFSLTGGNPLASVNQYDAGLFYQDDWKLRPAFTVSMGMRYEWQNHLTDWHDLAPRLGIAWGLGAKGNKAPRTVLRAGIGVFYDRVSESLTLNAERNDGVRQQQFVVDSPDYYPLVPTPAQLAASRQPQAIRELYAGNRAPQLAQIAVAAERQLPKNIVATVTYLHTHGLHELRSRNINAPVPGSGLLPYGGVSAIYLYEASGRFNQNQLIASVTARVNPKLTFNGSYTRNGADSDTDGSGTFPSDSYNLRPEYGQAAFGIRDRVQFNGSWSAPWGLRLSPFLTATSGRPFNITIGRDINGDTLFTDRPAFATGLPGPNVVRTAYGTFDTTPVAGQTIVPRNYGDGPGQVSFNVRFSKTITLSKAKEDPKELVFNVNARNILNHPNLAPPIGNLSSSRFGESVALAGGGGGGGGIAGVRRIDLQIRFNF